MVAVDGGGVGLQPALTILLTGTGVVLHPY